MGGRKHSKVKYVEMVVETKEFGHIVYFRLITQLGNNPSAMQFDQIDPWFDSCAGKIPWRRDRVPTLVFLGFPCGSAGKESSCNAGDLGSIPGLGRSPGEGKGYSLQYSGLENFMDVYSWGHKESDRTELLSLSLSYFRQENKRIFDAMRHEDIYFSTNKMDLNFMI